jgi:Bacterial membrane protein YfhO
VRYVLLPAGSSLSVGTGLRRIWGNADAVVYENTLAYPRAFFAESIRSVTDPEAIRKAVTADGFDGRRLALVESAEAPAVSAGSNDDRVTVTARSANQISLECRTASPRFLVLSEMYLPGWNAAVDGAATPIYRTNYLFRGIVVPAGRHTVTFSYRPRSVIIGAVMSGVALIAALAVFLAGRRPR